MRDIVTAQRLIALFVAGWLAFNFPLLALWEGGTSFFGVPGFAAAIFGAWAALIALVAWVSDRGDDEP